MSNNERAFSVTVCGFVRSLYLGGREERGGELSEGKR